MRAVIPRVAYCVLFLQLFPCCLGIKQDVILGPGQTTRFFTRFCTQQKIEEKIEPFGHLVECVEWSRVMLSEV